MLLLPSAPSVCQLCESDSPPNCPLPKLGLVDTDRLLYDILHHSLMLLALRRNIMGDALESLMPLVWA